MKMQPKILIIPDKFKQSFTSTEIAKVIAKSLEKQGFTSVFSAPVSDGGEGFLEAINSVLDLKFIEHQSKNAIFENLKTKFAIFGKTAFLESAKTIGIGLLPINIRNPLYSSSYGLGLQIIDVLKYDVEKIIIGLGGSATTDGGMGMANALGYDFYDCYDSILEPIGLNLNKICRISGKLNEKLKNIEIIGLSDVNNPMLGQKGAAYSFARQKGANYEQIVELDRGLMNLKNLFVEQFGEFSKETMHEGAAGGVGFGIKYFFKKTTIAIVGISSVGDNYENLKIISLEDKRIRVSKQRSYTIKHINELNFENLIGNL